MSEEVGWHKIELTDPLGQLKLYHQIREDFIRHYCHLANKPSGAVLLADIDPKNPEPQPTVVSYYLSPPAVYMFDVATLEQYGARHCPKPPLDHIYFVAGDESFRSLLRESSTR